MRTLQTLSTPKALQAASDARRLYLLRLLMRAPATLTQLAREVGQSPAWVRHHLQVLERAGLVRLHEVRKRGRTTEKYYCACAEGLLLQHWVLPLTHQPIAIFSGSHDFALELLARLVEPNLWLLLMPTGSLNGLVNLRQGLCHLAGAHLHETGGQFNLATLRHLFPDRPVQVMTLAHRVQGLILSPGNPLGIREIGDLERPDVRWVGRNLGSGTQLWLQREVHTRGLHLTPPIQVVATHTEAAALVAQRQADVAIGLQAAAVQFNLEFIPLFEERYDLVFSHEHLDQLTPLLDYVHTAAFRTEAAALPGYRTTHSGNIFSLEVTK